MIIWYIGSILLSFSIVVLHYLIRQFLCATASTLPLPSVSPIGVLSADHYMYLVSLDLPTILAFSLLSTLLPVDPLPLLGSMTPVYHHLAYVPLSTSFYHPSISSYNDCGYCHRYDFLVCLLDWTYFFELFKLLFSLGIDHDPPCSLCSHDL